MSGWLSSWNGGRKGWELTWYSSFGTDFNYDTGRPHGPGPSGGMGDARRTQRVRKVRHARLRVMTAHLTSA